MSAVLDILSCGAVSPIGLDAFQTAAAFRARIAGFEYSIPLTPPQEPLRAARVPARASLRRTPAEWLVNLAARGLREVCGYRSVAGRLGLILSLPEKFRDHPALAGSDAGRLLGSIVAASGLRFDRELLGGEGGAGTAIGLQIARDLMRRGHLDACVVGGADSLVNTRDVVRLRGNGRMLEPGNPEGLIPGEGSGFLLVALPGRFNEAIARVVGVASATEKDDVLGRRFSQGRAFAAALASATEDGALRESSIAFRVSTLNGERYAVWESMFFATRFYRTRRERLPIWYVASSVGEMGAASGAVAAVLAAVAIAGGYAPGPYAMCESASESGLRGACLIAPAAGAPLPPFRPEEGASLHLLRSLCRVR